MNAEWSELNKKMQLLIKKRDTFSEGIGVLLSLRGKLLEQIKQFRDRLSDDDFCAMPFKNAKGYHSKTVAYSLWHIFRIEDIVVHTLITGDEQVFFTGDYQKRIGSPIITTGNELLGEQIREFSQQLYIGELYRYITDVDKATAKLLSALSFDDLKSKVSPEQKSALTDLEVVSRDENAFWLVDYWCGKDVRGLIQMPLSRHWIMHIEACLRIISKLPAKAGNARYKCPCCGCLTYAVPPEKDAGFICPVCFWENDPFIRSESERSDANSGLTLSAARENYRRCGACEPTMVKYVRAPLDGEL